MGTPRSSNHQTVLASLTLAPLTPKATQPAVRSPSNSVAYNNVTTLSAPENLLCGLAAAGSQSSLKTSETYNNSAVLDVSDNGRVAVGQLSTCLVQPDSPPQLAFIWTAPSGLVFVNDLMAAYGQPDAHYYLGTDVSRDGNHVLVVGNPPLRDAQDTPDLTLDLTWLTPIPTLRRSPSPSPTPSPGPSRQHVTGYELRKKSLSTISKTFRVTSGGISTVHL